MKKKSTDYINVEALLKELIKIDILHLRKDIINEDLIINQINNFYKITNLNLLSDIYNFLKKFNNKKFSKIKENWSNVFIAKISINFISNKEIKNENDLFLILFSIFIYKSLNNIKLAVNSDNNDFNTDKSLNTKNHSDAIINEVIKFITNLSIWLEIITNEKIFINEKDLRLVIHLIFEKLNEIKIINKIKIFDKINKKTNIFYFVENSEIFSSCIVLSYTPHKIYKKSSHEWYLYSYHFSNINKILKENPLSGQTLIFEKEEIELMDNLCNNWIIIDKNLLKIMFNELCKEEGIEENKLNEYYKKLNKELINSFSENNKNMISIFAKKMSGVLNLFRIKIILDSEIENHKIFLPFFFDFRGRLYYLSHVSPTSYKEFRYCIHWGKYENFNVKPHVLNIVAENELKKRLYLIENFEIWNPDSLKLEKWNFSKKHENVKKAVIWIMISLAEIEKKKKKTITVDEFILWALDILKEKNIDKYSYKNKIKIIYYKYILHEINNDIYIKRPISKDATASVFQHIIKNLPPKNENTLVICNLASFDTWYDTYKYIIEDFVETNKIISYYLTEEDFSKIFSRDILKKIIMIYNYGAGKKRCISDFKIEIENITKNWEFNKKNEVEIIFYKFYDYLSKNNIIFAKPVDLISEKIKEKNNILKIDSTIINFVYKRTKIVQIELKHEKKRYTRQQTSLLTIIDKKKTHRSSKANYIQSLDAALARWYLRNNRGITIHDCFLQDYINTTFLISKINEGMRIIFHDLNLEGRIDTSNLYSLFIIL